jgi:hypothetical protein
MDLVKEHTLKNIMLTLIKAANKPNKKKAARQKKCVSEGCTNQSVSFGKCISHGAKVNKTKCKALFSSGERCKKYAQKYGLFRKQVNSNIDDIIQNPLECEVIHESQGPEEGK